MKSKCYGAAGIHEIVTHTNIVRSVCTSKLTALVDGTYSNVL